MLKTGIKKIDYHKLYYSHDAIRVGIFGKVKISAVKLANKLS